MADPALNPDYSKAIWSVHGCENPDRFAPLPEDHPAVRDRVCCPGCDTPLRPGDRVMFVNGRPADDEEAAKAAAGRAHNQQVDLAHQDCAIHAALSGEAVAYA